MKDSKKQSEEKEILQQRLLAIDPRYQVGLYEAEEISTLCDLLSGQFGWNTDASLTAYGHARFENRLRRPSSIRGWQRMISAIVDRLGGSMEPNDLEEIAEEVFQVAGKNIDPFLVGRDLHARYRSEGCEHASLQKP